MGPESRNQLQPCEVGLPVSNATSAPADVRRSARARRVRFDRVMASLCRIARAGTSSRRAGLGPQLFSVGRGHQPECDFCPAHPDERIAAFHCRAVRMSLHLHGMSVWDVTAIVMLGAMAVLCAVGTRRLAARGARVRRAERIAFWCGWIAAIVALLPPIDTTAQRLFSVHMFQHELLMLVATPLMIAGRPILGVLWGLPDAVRMRIARSAGTAVIGRLAALVAMPAVAWFLHGATLWAWHAPLLYEAAVRTESVHAFQHI